MCRFSYSLFLFLLATSAVHPARAELQPARWTREPDASAVRAALFLRKARWLQAHYLQDDYVRALTRTELDKYRSEIAVKQAVVVPAGEHEEAYFSRIEGRSAQPFLVYLPEKVAKPDTPLLLYLHGYTPTLDLVNWGPIPAALTDTAARIGACVAAPFGRSNTDFQGIGEQDVLHVIDLMHQRYHISTNHVVLCGYSMGGMGAWTLSARFTERFAGAAIIAGRADWYAWQQLDRASVPAWHRTLIDAAFTPKYLPRMRNLPLLVAHGTEDPLVPIREARHAAHLARDAGIPLAYCELPGGDHWIFEEFVAHEDFLAWLKKTLLGANALARPVPLGIRPGETPSRLQNALLDPFVFVFENKSHRAKETRLMRTFEWIRFAKETPAVIHDAEATGKALADKHVIAFGEPEHSESVRRILASGGVQVQSNQFTIAERTLPRDGHGLWFSTPSPWNSNRTAIVQCGLPWGPQLSYNHIYDTIPDVIVYGDNRSNGVPVAVAAGYWKTTAHQIIWCEE